jgi:hypothetical protein
MMPTFIAPLIDLDQPLREIVVALHAQHRDQLAAVPLRRRASFTRSLSRVVGLPARRAAGVSTWQAS